MTALASLLKLSVIGFLLAELSARAGEGPAVFIAPGSAAPLRRYGVAALLGLLSLGLVLLALSLTGLFYPGAVAAALPLLGLASRGMYSRRLFTLDALRGLREMPRVGTVLLALAAAAGGLVTLVTVGEVDSHLHHLALSWQYLRAHRVLLDSVPLVFQVPAPTDILLVFGALAGDDRLAGWISGVWVFSALAVISSERLEDGDRRSAWLGPLLVLASDFGLVYLGEGKSDGPASALLVAGMVLWLSGSRRLGAVLMGAGVAGKFVYLPLAAAWLVFNPPPLGRRLPLAALFAFPVVPWLAKTYLATGNPLFPFAPEWLPTFDWGPANRSSFHEHQSGLWARDTTIPAAIPFAWFRHLAVAYPAAALAVPGLIIFTRWRRPVLACIVAQMATLAMGHLDRYMAPATWFILLAAARSLPQDGWRLRAAVPLAAAYSVLRIAVALAPRAAEWRDAALPFGELYVKRMTTYAAAMTDPGLKGARRILTIGEIRSHRAPARAVYGGGMGETPLVWRIFRESFDPGQVRRRFRQLGVDAVVYNYVSVGWIVRISGQYFRWDDRMFALYKRFWLANMAEAMSSERMDFTNGGFVFYRMLDRPRKPPARDMYYIPGADSWANVFSGGQNYSMEMVDATIEKARRNPEILTVQASLASIQAYIFGQWRDALDILKPLMAAGHTAYPILEIFGVSALSVGDYDAAIDALGRARERYGVGTDTIRLTLGESHLGRAIREMDAGRAERAERDLDAAREALGFSFGAGATAHERRRRASLATVLAGKGDILMRRGDCRGAVSLFRESLELDPGTDEIHAQRMRLASVDCSR